MNKENLGPGEEIIQSLLTYTDHMHHGRPGLVVADLRTKVGVRWDFATYKVEGETKEKVAYRLTKSGKKTVETRAGIISEHGLILDGARAAGYWREPGLFPEVVAWMYQRVADVWKLDNEFAARWASYQFAQEHRDLKVVLAAFMLVQSRKGDPVIENGAVAFHDDDYRDVGEAMMLVYKKDVSLSPKLLLRIREVLEVPAVVEINRKLGFGRSAREPVLGRWPKVVAKWLRYREDNHKLLEGLIKGGMRSTVIALCKRSGYKPESPAFFQALRWKQSQAKDGRRTIAIGQAVAAAESWEGMTEGDICQTIATKKPAWKRIVSLIPKAVGLTRAIAACAIESGCMSDKDLIIMTPTIEELGLMDDAQVKARWDKAVKAADDTRAANIASRVKGKAVKEQLEAAAEVAVQKAVEEVMKDMRVYVMVDRSGSMQGAIDQAILLLTKLLPAFPEDKMHVSHFNTSGQEVTFKARTAAGVGQAFRGVAASGGTDYGAGVYALIKNKPKDSEDVLFIFVGDQESTAFAHAVRASELRPMAFGFVYSGSGTFAVPGTTAFPNGRGPAVMGAVEQTASELGIPCFRIAQDTFADTYAIPRTIRALVAATPVGAATATRAVVSKRVTLAETILATKLLEKPQWA